MQAFAVLLLLLPLPLTTWCQIQGPRILEKKEIAFALSGEDSLKRHVIVARYDLSGRLIQEKKYYYHHQNARLIKEEIDVFDTNTQVLTERIIQYPENKDPKHQRLETKYLVYSADAGLNKRIWRKLWDDFGDIVKEDTLSYDADSNLIGQCNYDYRGNTSLYCHEYSYNKKGHRIRWKTYYKWTTIDAKGDVANKQAKRRDFRYKYTKDGLLKRSFGKYYLNKYRQIRCYNRDNTLQVDKTWAHKTNKYKDPNTGRYKKKRSKEKKESWYQEGILKKEQYYVNQNEQKRTEKTIEQGLVLKEERFKQGKLSEAFQNSYDSGSILRKTHIKYNGQEKERYRIITDYNQDGKPMKELQMIGNKQLSVYSYHYNTNGLIQSKSLSLNNGETLEKTIYIYKLY